MNLSRRAACVAAVALSLASLQGCATKIKASTAQNPPPPQAFNYYGRVDIKPVAYQQGYKGNPELLTKISANLDKEMGPFVHTWNARPANGRSLTVEPIVEEVSHKSVTKRVFLGPFAGSSGVLMRMTIKDQNGNVVAAPEFFQRTAPMSGYITFGAQDNLMFMRVAKLASGYIVDNYSQAVGGPTGADEQAIAH